ncbi:MAG: hypothetical protein R3B93_26790 [Bacteroidia bacterium]
MSHFFSHVWKLLILALIFSCADGETKFGTKVIASQFAVTLPDYLSPVKNLNDDAPLQMGNNIQEIYLIARFNDWKDLRKKHADWEIEDYYDFHIENLLLEVQEPTAPGPDSVAINGLNALVGYYEGKLKEDEIYCKLVMLESEKTLYQLLIWTKKGNLPLYEADMDKIIRSFKEV